MRGIRPPGSGTLSNPLFALAFAIYEFRAIAERDLLRRSIRTMSAEKQGDRHVLAMFGFSTRGKDYFVSFISVEQDGHLIQTTSCSKPVVARSKFFDAWSATVCKGGSPAEVLDLHIKTVKRRNDRNSLFLNLSDDKVEEIDQYIDHINLSAIANMWRKSLWRI